MEIDKWTNGVFNIIAHFILKEVLLLRKITNMTHQVLNTALYLKEIFIDSRNDGEEIWSMLRKQRENSNFKILKVTARTIQTAIDFVKERRFYISFNQATHWFIIVINVIAGPLKLAAEYLSSELVSFDHLKPVIIQWESIQCSEYLIFFRQSNEHNFCLLYINNKTSFKEEDFISHGNFDISLIFEALRNGIGGSFGETLLNTTLDTKRELDMWRLIDYAAKGDDSLSLRFLMLFNWNLLERNQDGRNVLEIAAENASPQTVSALLDLPIILENKNVLSEEQKQLLNLSDTDETPLTIIAERGKASTLKFLIDCGVDINRRCKVRGQHLTLIDLAWNSHRYDNVLTLLQADSLYPSEYNLSNLEGRKQTVALKKFSEEVVQFHQALQENDIDKIVCFTEHYPRLKKVYDQNNQSALITALEARQFEAFVLLQSKGFISAQNEDLTLAYEALNVQEKEKLKLIKLKYFKKQHNAHIIFLLSKSKVYYEGILKEPNENHVSIIQELFEQLDNIPETSAILKVLEHAEFIQITFGFNTNAVINQNNRHPAIIPNSKTDSLYIEVKERSHTLHLLAKGLAHLAIQTVYRNNSKPYTSLDKLTEYTFKEIIDIYHSRSEVLEPIIRDIFNNRLNTNDWPSELIVCVPILLVCYGNQVLEIKEHLPELFAFYENHIQKDFMIFIDEYARIGCEFKVQSLNDLLGELDKIQQSKIWLKEHLCAFDMFYPCTITIIVTNSPKLAKSDLYQTLTSKHSLLYVKSNNIFATSNHLKNRPQAQEIYNIHRSPIKPTLIVDCSCDYGSNYQSLWAAINDFLQNGRIILIVKEPPCDENFKKVFTVNKYYTWKDLDNDTQTFMQQKSIDFQGHNVTLQELAVTDTFITTSVPLELLEKQSIKIGEPLQMPFGFDESYYIKRTFISQLVIEDRILKDKRDGIISDHLAYSETEFHKLCTKYPDSRIHWLSKEQPGQLIWKQSRGSTRNLNEYIAVENQRNFSTENIESLLEQAQRQRIIIISDTAGMGKTTILAHLSKKIKAIFPTYWVCLFNLNMYTEELEKQSKEQMETVEFIIEELLKLSSPLERAVFEQLLSMKRVILMLDGFDEISPLYEAVATNLLVGLRNTSVEQIWISTRPHLALHLEQLVYRLKPFSQEDQIDFLVKFWRKKAEIITKNESRMRLYARALLEKLSGSMNDRGKLFAGIPLQTRLLAEAFLQEFSDYHSSKTDTISNLPNQLDIVDAYTRFLRSKYQIYVKEKGRPPNITVATRDLLRILKGENLRKLHQQLALEILFPQEKESLLKAKKLHILPKEQISRIGIVQYIGPKAYFTHQTFAEYYVADFFVNQLITQNSNSTSTQIFLLKKILLQENLQNIRIFFDGLLSKISNPFQQAILTEYGNQINELWETNSLRWLENTILYIAVEERNSVIIKFLLHCLKMGKYTKTLAELLLDRTNYNRTSHRRRTVMYQAASDGLLDMLDILWLWANEARLNSSSQFTRLFLAKDEMSISLWHEIAKQGHADVFDKLYDWAIKVLHSSEVKKIFYHKDMSFKTVWHHAISSANFELMEKLWFRAKEINLEPEHITEILLHVDNQGQSMWHYEAANESQHLYMSPKLMEWAQEAQISLSDLKQIFCRKGKNGETIFQQAAISGSVSKLEKIWELGKGIHLNHEDLKHMLLNKNDMNETVCHGIMKHEHVLNKVWVFAKALKFNVEELKQLFFSSNTRHENTWLKASSEGSSHILDNLWAIAQDMHLTTNEIKQLLVISNIYGENVWYLAINKGQVEIMEKFWSYFKKVSLSKTELKQIMLKRSRLNINSLQLITELNGVVLLRKLLDLMEDVFTLQEISDMLMTNVNQLEILWHHASINQHTGVLDIIHSWGSEKLDGNMLNNFLHARNRYDKSMSIVFMWKGQSLERVFKWCQENLPLTEIKNVILRKQLLGEYAWNSKWGHEKALIVELINWCKQNLTISEIGIVMKSDDTCWHTLYQVMVEDAYLEVFINLWDWDKDVEVSTHFKSTVFAVGTKEYPADTVLHFAMRNRDINLLMKVWEWGKLMRFTKEDFAKLVLTRDKYLNTFLHIAEWLNKKESAVKLLEEALNSTKTILEWQDFKELFIAKNQDSQSILHLMAYSKQTDELLQLLQWCTKHFTVAEFEELMLDKNQRGGTILHTLAKRELQGWFKVVEWLETNLDKEVFRKILLAVDNRGRSSIRILQVQAAIGWTKKTLSEEMFEKIGNFDLEQRCNPEIRTIDPF